LTRQMLGYLSTKPGSSPENKCASHSHSQSHNRNTSMPDSL
jgi:hypothetical protein